jgi:hypothetical protein
MDRDTIIDGLRMTMDLCVFDPSTGEEIEPHLLNDINRATYDACKGALEILERLDTDSDTISRQAAIDALRKMQTYKLFSGDDMLLIDQAGAQTELMLLPSAQPEQRYTEEELGVFQHGISLSLLSKRSAQHWRYDEDTATEIKFLERLYEKVGADMGR